MMGALLPYSSPDGYYDKIKEYDSKADTHLFYREDEVQCRLRKGKYLLPMDEFMLTEIRDHPKNGPDIPQ